MIVMPKIPGWSDEDAAAAATQGWSLVDVYDLAKKTFGYEILPNPIGRSPKHVQMYVNVRAQHGDDFARRALDIIRGKHANRKK